MGLLHASLAKVCGVTALLPLRRAVQAVCEGRDPGDLTTMDDPAALQQIKDLVAG